MLVRNIKETVLPAPLDELSPKEYIIIKGAKAHNLKGLSVAIPRNKLVVITGLSGSGKSSLAFDTLFAEGQRMYVETLSSYARQFVGRMEKPEVEYIRGVSPAIAIEQKVSTKNPRSTVGTSTEIYDYLKLFFARIGKTYSPVSGQEVRRETVGDVVNYLNSLPPGTKTMIVSPVRIRQDRNLQTEIQVLLSKGFPRLLVDGKVVFTEDYLAGLPGPSKEKKKKEQVPAQEIFILIDRAVIQPGEEESFRLADSVQTAFFEGEGTLQIRHDDISRDFSDRFEADGIRFEEPSVNLFSFNNSYGACKTCDGFGNVLGIDPQLVFPDPNLSVFEGAIAPWNSENLKREWLQPLLRSGIMFNFPIHRSYYQLSEEEKKLLWTGNEHFAGLDAYFRYLESNLYKIQYRVQLSRYRGRTTCPDCKGSRLRKDAGYVQVEGKSIIDLVLLSIGELTPWFSNLKLSEFDARVTRQILKEIQNRLHYMQEVGLGYLSLNRLTSTLSGGEYQRIKLATSLGSALVGSMYILDEPSIGLHPRDTRRLVRVLKSLRDLGNTVVVVEHEEEIMLAADQLIDIGPDAGSGGGELVFQGCVTEDSLPDAADSPFAARSHTYRFLNGLDEIALPPQRRKWRDFIRILGASENNLKNLDVQIPLHILTVITGVSGSGKSTLINKVFYPAIGKMLGMNTPEVGKFLKLEGSYQKIQQAEYVDQNPIGKSSRSNPVSYIKAYDLVRNLMSEQALSVQRGYKPSHFSFNVEGGRCEMCQGEGLTKIEMQFMADIYLTCEACGGKRFMQEVLEVEWQGKNISDILQMTVDEAVAFFAPQLRIADKIRVLQEVGLGYVQLGQSSNTLSGGEAQRVKLAYYLSLGKNEAQNMLFIFDEPTTGLHFHDIGQLLKAINRLVDRGNSVILIEHNMEVIKSADWIIDLGPEGGSEGGNLMFEGTPEDMVQTGKGHTADFLRQKMGV
jgi:excinuclease ABC subunit A